MPDEPLSVAVMGNEIQVSLATSAGALSSTAAQVVAAIDAHAGAAALVKALTYRGNAGVGIVQARPKVNLSDFLEAPAHVERGQFEYSVMRIGERRDGKRTGVFLYCQQHAREWATPLTCLETAEQILRNYAIDKQVRKLVDSLEIFILPSSNPDGSHYSLYDFNSQRKNMTAHCVIGGKETDNPNAANFWTPALNPVTGAPVHELRPGVAGRLGHRHEPQQHGRDALRRLHRRVDLVHQRGLHGPERGVGAGDQERALDCGHVQEHQVLEQHPQLRRLLHVGAGHVLAEPRRG